MIVHYDTEKKAKNPSLSSHLIELSYQYFIVLFILNPVPLLRTILHAPPRPLWGSPAPAPRTPSGPEPPCSPLSSEVSANAPSSLRARPDTEPAERATFRPDRTFKIFDFGSRLVMSTFQVCTSGYVEIVMWTK